MIRTTGTGVSDLGSNNEPKKLTIARIEADWALQHRGLGQAAKQAGEQGKA
nr:hypothetical protein GCM10020185_56540 [Pseudomonas brassicacearum subsp. brassicacearum]